MREEDKVLLLSEIMGMDTKAYVKKYIEELRISSEFLKLCENVNAARKVRSYKAQWLIGEFELIDFDNVDSLVDFYKLDAKIHYLLSNSESKDYLNPFFYNADETNNRVGQIALDFDSQRFLLDDIILDERYTKRYKIDYIKDSYLSWRKEVKEMIIDPLKNMAINIDQLPKLEMFDTEYRIYLILVILTNIFFLIAPFILPEYLGSLYNGTLNSPVAEILYYISFGITFLLDIYFVVTINHRFNVTRSYRTARELIEKADAILKEIDIKCEKFYEYVLNCLSEAKPLQNELSLYTIDDKYLMAISYLLKVSENEKIEREEDIEISLFAKLGFFFVVCLLISFFIVVFLGEGEIV